MVCTEPMAAIDHTMTSARKAPSINLVSPHGECTRVVCEGGNFWNARGYIDAMVTGVAGER